MKSILDPTFKYRPAAHTDIRVSIRKEKKRLADLKLQAEADAAEAKSKTTQLKRRAI